MSAGVNKHYDLIVIGGGSAGLAAAVAARTCGVANVLLLERDESLGGILNQCVHDGFGLHAVGAALTGPEYIDHWIARALEQGIQIALGCTALEVSEVGESQERPQPQGGDTPQEPQGGGTPQERPQGGGFIVEVIGAALGGHVLLDATSVVVATGCRERTRGQLLIPGSRPAGVLTAGTAQYMVNVKNQLPGSRVVILGSGDIGLIMARRMKLEGAEVRLVLGQEATGLLRNHVRCITEFDIPIRYGWGILSIHGYGQLKGVMVAPLDEQGALIRERREYVRCDTLLIACGLIPEREIVQGIVQQRGSLDRVPGLFACGNAATPHDLVDQVSVESVAAGIAAARFIDSMACVPKDLSAFASKVISEPKGHMNELGQLGKLGQLGGAKGELMVCTACPTSCVLDVVRATSTGVVDVSGNACARGVEFATEELLRPLRLFTGTVRVHLGEGVGAAAQPLLPVRTATEVPREALLAVAACCRMITVNLPVKPGQVIEPNIANTGVALIAQTGRE